LDPFCGSGTTLLACRELGLRSMGFDVLPLSVFASHVKTQDYDAEALKAASRELFSPRFERLKADFPPFMRRAFSKYALEDVIFFRKQIAHVPSERERNFLLLALISASIKASYAWKDGAVVKIRKTSKPPLRFLLKHVVKKMIKDTERISLGSAAAAVAQQDARRMDLEDSSIDAIITSPPYLNNIDYTKVYEIENWFLSGMYEMPSIRSYIGLFEGIDFLPELSLPQPAMAYFSDMNMVLREMHRVLKAGGRAAIVVGNAYMDGMTIDSDLILAYLAEQAGFEVAEISVLNERFALVDRTKKKGILRESAIILRK
jgi:DNA modification methylase